MTSEKDKKIPRPPVVVVMGHIDHGKSKLLDYIRKNNVVEKAASSEPRSKFIDVEEREAGGITQHIGAYEAEVKCDTDHPHKTRKITFLDTPGHEAFSKMRTRGAKIADVAILVIAADEGIKPQTMEAYNAIKKSDIPFVIAFNKMDKSNADPEKAKGQLAEQQIFVEGYGGTIPHANISATTGQGIDDLLDLALLMTDMENLTADPTENASGVVIESHLDPKRGVSATLLIQNGTMKTGMCVVSGNAKAPIRIFEDFQGKPLKEASFSSPVKIIGFNALPEVGEKFETFETKKEAELCVKSQLHEKRLTQIDQTEKDTGKIIIPLVIKADTSGSAEALEKEISELSDEQIIINILRNDVGNIKEDDVKLVSGAKNPVILGFNVEIEATAKELIERFKIDFYLSNIIYKISEWLEEKIKEKKAMMPREEIWGKVRILKTFSKEKNKQVLGGEVISGKIIEGKIFKIKRRESEIGEGKILELQQNKVRTKEVNEGNQFGAMTESKIEINKGDELEIIEKIK
ncbi:MAG: translation initiation factor IF-2 [Patescibacteria group bacterium]